MEAGFVEFFLALCGSWFVMALFQTAATPLLLGFALAMGATLHGRLHVWIVSVLGIVTVFLIATAPGAVVGIYVRPVDTLGRFASMVSIGTLAQFAFGHYLVLQRLRNGYYTDETDRTGNDLSRQFVVDMVLLCAAPLLFLAAVFFPVSGLGRFAGNVLLFAGWLFSLPYIGWIFFIWMGIKIVEVLWHVVWPLFVGAVLEGVLKGLGWLR